MFAQCRHFEKWSVIGLTRFFRFLGLCQVQKGCPFVCRPPACGFTVSPTGSDVTMRSGAPALCPGAPCPLLPPPHVPAAATWSSPLCPLTWTRPQPYPLLRALLPPHLPLVTLVLCPLPAGECAGVSVSVRPPPGSDHITHLSESLWLLRLVGQRPASWPGQRWRVLYSLPRPPAWSQQACTRALPKQSVSSCFEVYLQVSKSHNRNDPKCTPPSCPHPPETRQSSRVSHMDANLHCLFLAYIKGSLSPTDFTPFTRARLPPEPSPCGGWQVISSIFVLKVLPLGAWWECWGLASGTLQSRPLGR